MSASYDEEAKKLAKLPRSKRFEALISFPAEHIIKIIGKTEGFVAVVKAAMDELGYPDLIPMERPSAKGKFISLTLTVRVKSGLELDRIYGALEKLPNLAYLL